MDSRNCYLQVLTIFPTFLGYCLGIKNEGICSSGFPSSCHQKRSHTTIARKTHLCFLICNVSSFCKTLKYQYYYLNPVWKKKTYFQTKEVELLKCWGVITQCFKSQHQSFMFLGKNIFPVFHNQNVNVVYWDSKHFKCFKIVLFISV